MNYNDYVESDQLKNSLSWLFNLNCSELHKVALDAINVIQPKNSFITCQRLGKEYNYLVECTIKVVEGDRTGETFMTTLRIPKMCERGFLIRNKSGKLKWRSPISIGDIKRCISISGGKVANKIFIGGLGTINIKDSVDKSGKIIPTNIMLNTSESTIPVCNLYDFLESGGVPSTDIQKYIRKVDADLSSQVKSWIDPKKIKLEIAEWAIEKIINKFIQLTKTKSSLSTTNRIMNAKDLYKLIEIANEYPSRFSSFSPFDVNFYEFAEIIFEHELRKVKNFKSSLAFTLTKQFKNNSSLHLNGDSISNKIMSMFNMQDVEWNGLQSSATSNAVSMISQTNKIYFRNKEGKQKINYTKDFYGLICPDKTPENVGLCNIKNELAHDIILKNKKPFIKLYDKNLKEVTIPYEDYYSSRILSIDYYDYELNKIVPDKNGNVEIIEMGETKTVHFTNDCYDYLRLSPHGALSVSAGLIPFINHCDGVRNSMATNMLDQMIPVVGGRPSICRTSVAKEVYDRSDFNYKSDYDGEVVAITDEYIKIKTDTGFRLVEVPDSVESSYHTFTRFRPAVKVGDKIKKNSVIIESDSFKNGELALGVPLKVAYFIYKSKTDEDATVISESASKLLAHKLNKETIIRIPLDAQYLFHRDGLMGELGSEASLVNKEKLNEFGLPNIGESFTSEEIMAIYLTEADKNSMKGKLTSIMTRRADKNNPEIPKVIKMIKAPYGNKESKVVKIKIEISNHASGGVIQKISEYYDNVSRFYNKELLDSLPDNELPKIIQKTNSKSYSIQITITTESINYVKRGDKLTNRYASKCTVSAVLPDDKMPRVGGKDGPNIDIIIPPTSTMNRKNLGQLFECNLIELSKIAFEQNEKLLKSKNFNKIRDNLNKLHVTRKYSKYTDEEIIAYHNQYHDAYSVEVEAIDHKYGPESMKSLCDYFGYNMEGYYLYIAETGRMTELPSLVGTTEIFRLHHRPETKAKATGDSQLVPQELTLGLGSGREGGQRIGQMELWALQAYGTLSDFKDLNNNKYSVYEAMTNEVIMYFNLLSLDLVTDLD